MQPLDPLTIPLHGRRLLEASAGTGKTYCLALLFLRLLMERRLEVNQILVVTFTRPATGELRDRIRARVRDCLDLLDGRAVNDPTLTALVAAHPADQARRLLNDALVRMDEAAIFTIHGFCQRVLQDNAFEAGTLFETQVLELEEDLRQEVIEDFWRNRFYGATVEEAAWAAKLWTEPAGLLKRLGRVSATLDMELVPEIDAAEVEALGQQSRALLAEVRREWASAHGMVAQILADAPCLKRDAHTYRQPDQVRALIAAMDQLAAGPQGPYLLPAGIERLSAGVMAKNIKKKYTEPPDHPFFRLFERFWHSHCRWIDLLAIQVLHQARAFLFDELDRRKQRQGVMGFDDMLTHLERALARNAGGDRLAAMLVQRYPAALVDEFQDTDPVQYRLFSRIYEQGGTLFMIGDPKQAIYAFRGADIFTYIRARRDTPATHLYTMATNHRSTPAMVDAVNTLFGLCDNAFIFAHDIPFHPVQAVAGRAHPLVIDGRPAAPLTALVLDSTHLAQGRSATINKENATNEAAAACAEEIVTLLSRAATGRARLGDRPLGAGDIAILAPTHRTAETMRQALVDRGLHSVSLVQQSVFATDEARQLTLTLAALSDLTDAARVRAALATDLFGLDALHLHAYKEGDPGWSDQIDQLAGYQRRWRDQGVLAMFQQLLAEQQVTRRLTARPGGARALTNYLHLAELLQDSPAARHSMAGLLRWLRQQRSAPGNAAETQLIRLEDDDQLIRIVTIHRAKGLEFPVVLLPFPWSARTPAADDLIQFHHRDDLRLVLDLGTGNAEHRRLAAEEALAEQLRLLYVAVTRAKSCCLFCWGRVRGLERTALAHLLHAGCLPDSDETLLADLDHINGASPMLTVKPLPRPLAVTRMSIPPPTAMLAPRPFPGRILPGWGMTSYSRLIAGTDRDHDDDRQAVTRPASAAVDFDNIFAFPHGPAAGTCLHLVLERLDPTRPAADQQAMVGEMLTRGGIDLRWLPAVLRWLDEVALADLTDGCCLRDLNRRDRISELEFLFPLEQIDIPACNALLASHGHEPLPAGTDALQGLMRGFIDLVFRHQGRYYLADYKSNHLGPDPSHYGPDALAACMREHRYPLQALIYTLALHRFLASRQPGYSYERHFGGGRYLFLRAMRAGAPAGTGIVAIRADAHLIDGLDRCCRGLEVG